jgi:putative two-component system response regulator
MARTMEASRLGALVSRMELPPTCIPDPMDASIVKRLGDLAIAFGNATTGGADLAPGATELGARACRALLRLPVTLHSQAVAAAFWEVARFCAARRLNVGLALEMARRLEDVGRLLGSLEWRRKALTLASSMLAFKANYASAMEHGWSALTLARAIGEPEGIAGAWVDLGVALSGAGMHQAGLKCFEVAIEQVSARQSETAARLVRRAALINIASSELHLGQHARGLQAAELAWSLTEGDVSTFATTSRLIGGRALVCLLLESGFVGRARRVCDSLLEEARHCECEAMVAETEIANGLCMVVEGRTAQGLECVRRGLEAIRRVQTSLRDGLQAAIRANEHAGESTAAAMLRRELALHNRLTQQQGMLELHRSHLCRLQAEDGTLPATLERKAEMVERLAITTEMREDPTGLGVFRVGRLARLLALEVGWSDPDAEALEVAARLHDIGKISIGDDIVATRRPLTAEEMQSMRAHCHVGADLLRQTELENARLAADVAAYHHEAWDGSGYPHGVGGTAIPLAARIVAIADAFDAMTGERPYRPRLGVDEALARLRDGAGRRHDPALVPQFVALVARLRDTVGDLDGYLAEGAARSPFMQAHRRLARRLAEKGR